MVSDRKLVKSIQAGDVEAYAFLVKKYQDRLLSFVYRYVGDWHKAEDVAQDTFVNVYKAIDRIDTTKKFSTYLFAAAKNTAIDNLRRAKRYAPLDHNLPARGDLYENSFRKHEAKRVKRAVAALGEMYKQVIRLYYFEDLSYAKIGQELDLPINTVKTRLRRAKDQLAEILKNES